jgi:N-ethylmaleimide reductase
MHDSNPGALFSYVAEQLNQFGLAYLHVVEAVYGAIGATIAFVLEAIRKPNS